jgi:hypothetical protein
MKKHKCKNQECNNMITGTGKTGMCQSCINTIITTGRIQTKATRDKISKKLKGHKVSKITRKKISKANSGENNGMFAKKVSKATRSKMSEAQTERYKDPKEREKTGKQSRKFWKNPELKKKLSLSLGGTGTPYEKLDLTYTIRHLPEYLEWRDKVYQRDNYTCQECGQMGYELEAHHLKRLSELLKEFLHLYSNYSPIEDKEILLQLALNYKLFWNLDNGQTLCKKCHKLTDNYGTKKLGDKNGY